MKGEGGGETAMSKTVGLPLAIAVKLILQGKIKDKGAVVPVSEAFYGPVLDELEHHGISFTEKDESGFNDSFFNAYI